MDSEQPKGIPPNDLVREWDPIAQEIVVKDRITYFADKYRAADQYSVRATGVALVAIIAAFAMTLSYLQASSMARDACAIVLVAWLAHEEADETDPAPKWLSDKRVDLDQVHNRCVESGYIK